MRGSRFVTVAALAALFASPSVGQEAVHVPAPVLLRSLLRLPANLDPQNSVPLVIGLHGGGSTAEGFLDLWDGVEGTEFAYLALRGPYPVPASSEPSFDWAMWPSADPTLMRRAGDLLPDYVAAAIAEVRSQVNISDVYLLGFSQGAIYSYLIGVGIPEQLRGLVILSGPGLASPIHTPFTAESAVPNWIEADDIAAASGLRVFLAHGRSDTAAEFALASESRDVLVRNGYDVTFRAFDGGHATPPPEVLAEIAAWIVAR